MSLSVADEAGLDVVRQLEKNRIVAIRGNDADVMDQILDEKFLYINHDGTLYNKHSYTNAVRTHELTYSSDFDLTETDRRVDGDVIILVGMMLGHAGSQAISRSIICATCESGGRAAVNGSSWRGNPPFCGVRPNIRGALRELGARRAIFSDCAGLAERRRELG
jgi:hypothetical protein